MADRRQRRRHPRKRRRKPRRRKIKRALIDPSINGGTDIISSMPDKILHHILSFLPTDWAIRTSILSRRWRHVLCETPCLDFYDCRREATAEEIGIGPSINGGTDIISSMPDEILHHILSFLLTDWAIRTSLLSRRWRHVWCETPCLDFYDHRREPTAAKIEQTLSSYRAPKIMSFDLGMYRRVPDKPQIDRWIEFAMSRNVEEELLLDFRIRETYSFPDSFYRSSSLEQLRVSFDMIPRCTVSWKSLRKLTLCDCNLYDESIANILSGSPVLETLRLLGCHVERLDLSKSPSLKRLEIRRSGRARGPTQIVAPQIHYLSLRLACSDEEPSTLVDVSSLAEADLDIRMESYETPYPFKPGFLQRAGSLQTMVLKMLTKLQNVERLAFGGPLLQILSLAELCGVPFPTLKVQTLTVETLFAGSVFPGIARLLQNSPGLKKLIAIASGSSNIEDMYIDSYLDSQGLHPDQCWRSKYEVFPTTAESHGMFVVRKVLCKVVPSFMEMVLRNGQTLETLVVRLESIYDFKIPPEWFEELLQIPPTLSNNNNVSIVLKLY